MKKTKKLLVVFTAVMLMGLTACGDTDTTETTPDVVEDALKEVTIITNADVVAMDPIAVTDEVSFIALKCINDGLVNIDANDEVVPGLAESWEVSDDGLVYTFYLAQDAVWSNGDPVTADNFVYAWQRLDNPDSVADYAFILETIRVKNAGEVHDGEMALDELGIVALDDKTVQVTLVAPCDFFLSTCAFAPLFPINQEYVESLGDQYAKTAENLISCGAYIMDTWVSGSEFSYVPNDTYLYADTVNLDRLTFKVAKDANSALMAFNSGDADIAPLSGVLVAANENRVEYTSFLQGYNWYFNYNQATGDLQNTNLRLALGFAVDKESLANDVLKDGSIASVGIVPVGLSYHDGEEFREVSDDYFVFNAELAQEYLEKAKAELGKDTIELELLFEDTDSSKNVAEFCKDQIETNLDGVTINLKSQTKKARLQLMNDGDYDFVITRWGPDYADAQTYLELFLEGVSMNTGSYYSEEYNELAQDAFFGDMSSDSDARWQAMQDLEKILMEDAGVCPLFQKGGAMLINPDVTGIEIHTVAINGYNHMDVVTD